MKRTYSKARVNNPLLVLRKAGYSPTKDPMTGDESYMVRLGPDLYPRFHLYVEDKGESYSFNLHLDQKKASYAGQASHGGEYEGPTIEREMKRIESWVTHVERDQPPGANPPTPFEQTKKHPKPWWNPFF